MSGRRGKSAALMVFSLCHMQVHNDMRRRSRVSNGLNRSGWLRTAVFLEERICYRESAQTGLTGWSG